MTKPFAPPKPEGLIRPMAKKAGDDRLILIDGSAYFYRAYYAIRGLANSKGFPTNAIYGFITMLTKVIKHFHPVSAVVVFDAKGPTFRDEMYADYKANRPPMPDDLSVQIPIIKETPRMYGIPSVELSGVEADDIIGTIVERMKKEGIECVIVSKDKDLMQLITDGVSMYDDAKNLTTDREGVKEAMGVYPERIVDLLALAGDSSDNIPGVNGIGPKGAVELIAAFGGVEEIYAALDKVERDSIRKKLEAGRDSALLSKRLAIIDRAVDIDTRMESFLLGKPDDERLRELFTKFEFKRLLAELGTDPAPVAQAPRTRELEVHCVRDAKDLSAMANRLEKEPIVAVNIEISSANAVNSEVVGFSFRAGGDGYYVPIRHTYIGAGDFLAVKETLKALKDLLDGEAVKKVGHNIKDLLVVLMKNGVSLSNLVDDAMISSYLLDPSGRHERGYLAERYLQRRIPSIEETAGKGAISLEEVEVERAAQFSCETTAAIGDLHAVLAPEVKEKGLCPLLEKIELPLIEVLAEMEINGVKVDLPFLDDLSRRFAERIGAIQKDIFEIAGEQFNIDSPKQLQRLLFETLKLPTGRKTKTGYSTDIEVLEELASLHPLPSRILNYRSLGKLKNTYIDALPRMVSKETGRIHTTYNQTATVTGRLSSSDPNLQNIPVKTAEGRMIRRAFVPEKGLSLVSADYSQIELRVLAHMSGDERLVKAFKEGKDVHTATAAEIFGVPLDKVTEEMRGKAKTINFGVIYGISAHGLTRQIEADHATAQEFINLYFQRYKGVKTFFDSILDEARKTSIVRTLLGRLRVLPDIRSNNGQIRSAAERAAINMPIQGTAADLMKMAMIEVWRRFRKEKLKSRLILQVHDELVVEALERERDTVVRILREAMEGIYPMNVPLVVDVAYGGNWAEMEKVA